MAPDLFLTALTHTSWATAHGGEHNERLEFLGDAVLQLAISELLYERRPDAREGELTRARQRLVNKDLLATLALELGLDEALRIGPGEQTAGLRQEAKPLSDAWEALLGAAYLALGYAAAREVVEHTVLPRLGNAPVVRDPKSRLQEWSQQQHGGQVPTYTLRERSGPDNDPLWTVEVRVAGAALGRGRARKKKDAEQHAAVDALRTLGLDR